MLSVAALQKAGSLAVSAVVSVDVATPRLCHPAPVVQDSMLLPVPVGMEADSAVALAAVVVVEEVSVAAAAADSAVVVIASVVLAVESDTRAIATGLVDKPLLTPLQAPVVDVEVSVEVSAAVAPAAPAVAAVDSIAE